MENIETVNTQNHTQTGTGVFKSFGYAKKSWIFSLITSILLFVLIIVLGASASSIQSLIDGGSAGVAGGMAILLIILSIAILAIGIVNLVFSIMLIVSSAGESDNPHKGLGLVAGILNLIFPFVGFILCIVYSSKAKTVQ